jgi:flavin-dependent dehydrogenase
VAAIAGTTDVIIVGGGPAGSATAVALARKGVRVVLLAKAVETSDSRTGETLPPDCQAHLQTLGVLDDVVGSGQLPSSGTTSIWGDAVKRESDFLFSQYGRGWHLDRPSFDAALLGSAARAGVRVLRGAHLTSVVVGSTGGVQVQARVADRVQPYSALLIVDATGRSASVIRRVGGRRRVLDKLIGITRWFHVTADRKLPARALVESVRNGWWFSAVIPGDRLVATYMTDADLIRSPGAYRIWSSALEAAPYTRERVAGLVAAGEVTIASAATGFCSGAVGVSWAAVGDAATTWDPLSGQGITKAICEAQSLADTIVHWLGGDSAGLHRYAEWVSQRFATYCMLRSWYYREERRWPAARFWQRRHQA